MTAHPSDGATTTCRRPPPTSRRSATPRRWPTRSRPPGRSAGPREGTFNAPNPTGPLSEGFDRVAIRPHAFVMDMFPYPSGRGPARRPPARLHRHRRLRPLPADARRQRAAHDGLRRVRAAGRAVRGPDRPAPAHDHLRATSTSSWRSCAGWVWATTSAAGRHHRPGLLPLDAVDLPADLQLVVRHRRRQGPPDRRADRRAGRRHPRSRARAPTHPAGRGPSCPTSSSGRSSTTTGWPTAAESSVNWAPGLGTVLSNEEVTADGRSERGNFPVFRRPLPQWMMRITAYADRLVRDLDQIDWPDKVRTMQRNWIGRSTGAHIALRAPTPATSRSSRPGRTRCSAPPTWCWRPNTRWSTR